MFFYFLVGKTNEQGAHYIKILFKGGWPSPPTPVFVDAEVVVTDLNNQVMNVCCNYSIF